MCPSSPTSTGQNFASCTSSTCNCNAPWTGNNGASPGGQCSSLNIGYCLGNTQGSKKSGYSCSAGANYCAPGYTNNVQLLSGTNYCVCQCQAIGGAPNGAGAGWTQGCGTSTGGAGSGGGTNYYCSGPGERTSAGVLERLAACVRRLHPRHKHKINPSLLLSLQSIMHQNSARVLEIQAFPTVWARQAYRATALGLLKVELWSASNVVEPRKPRSCPWEMSKITQPWHAPCCHPMTPSAQLALYHPRNGIPYSIKYSTISPTYLTDMTICFDVRIVSPLLLKNVTFKVSKAPQSNHHTGSNYCI